MQLINISEQYFNEIITVLGYPLITINDNESDVELDKKQIIDLCLIPAIREYYNWFPYVIMDETQVSSTFEIPFPDNETIGVIQASLNTNIFGASSLYPTGNPILNAAYFTYNQSMNKYGPYDYQSKGALWMQRAEQQTTIEMQKTFRINVDKHTRVVRGFTNMSSKLLISWAKYSENFDDIPQMRIPEVIKFCQSKVLEVVGNIRSMQNSETPNSFNYEQMLNRAKELKAESFDIWRLKSKICIMKG
jgi:hypothetical protein